MKIALGLEYDGAVFSGWQRQHHARTVQACLEEALSRVANHPVTTWCAGRTDAGVHALGQVVHFETEAVRTLRAWVLGTNANLPREVAVRWAVEVAPDFNARFSATARAYRYLILNQPTRLALWARHATWELRPLDAPRMHLAAQALVGEHDFSSFRAAGCQAHHPVRTVHHISVSREGSQVVLLVRANAFLQHMVRNFTGVLLAIGRGERPVAWTGELLAARDRTQAGVTAPPQGLYLTHVDYPPHFGIPPPEADFSRP
ncbi:MAG: hypothetical protein RL434_93 [Pseudomonadota bacterium]|jgi:tRNA pseudouridine38-40 synthase